MSTTTQAISRRSYQRQIPLILVSAIATIIIVYYFVPALPTAHPYKLVYDELLQWGPITSSFITLFGYLTMVVNHGRRVMNAQRNRTSYLSAILLGATVTFLILGIALPGGFAGIQYTTLYKYLVMYAGAGMYSAWIHHPYNCYRYFRFTSAYSALFFLTWLFVVFRELPVFVAIYPPLYEVGTWIEQVVNGSVQRAALGAAGVGTLILGIRALVGKEPGLIEMEI
ncbi:hypothetical protein MUP00_04095 [Candidatus Bathyarchaeota archaeon]|jgi:hypothetical protein|nr:hypothetical protein [Candidatus Bathyarchaeota archaeon]